MIKTVGSKFKKTLKLKFKKSFLSKCEENNMVYGSSRLLKRCIAKRLKISELLLVLASILVFGNLEAAIIEPMAPSSGNDQSILIQPGSPLGFNELEKNLDLLEEFKLFEEEGNQASELARRGLKYIQNGKREEGLRDLKQAWALDSTLLEVAVKIALIYIQDKKFKEALEFISQIQSIVPSDPLGYKLEGMAYAGLEENEKSNLAFEKAIELQPGAPDASLGLVINALNEKDLDKAIKILKQVLTHYPENQRTLLVLAQLESQAGKPDQAILRLEEAIKADAKAFLPRFLLAKLFLALGNNQKSLEVSETALEYFPDNISFQELKSLALLKKGSPEEAAKILEGVVNSKPEEITAYYNLALAYEQLNRNSEAIKALDQALQIDSKNIPSKFKKAQLLAEVGKFDLAYQNLLALDKASPNNVEILQLLAKTSLAQNRNNDAVNYFEKALKVKTDNRLNIEYAFALMKANQLQKSYRVLEVWIEKNPSDILTKSALADLFLAKKQNDRAQKLYSEILSDQPNNPGVLNNLAWILSQKGLNKEALVHASKALELLPSNPQIMDTNSSILLKLGNVEKAMGLINAAIKKAPNDPQLRFHQAKVLVGMGDKEQAKKILEQVVRKDNFNEIDQAKKLLNELKANP